MVAEETCELIQQAQAGDKHAESLLLEKNNGLICSIMRRFFGRGIEQDDLYQLAAMGFIKAVRGFDCAYGTAFSTYAVPKIAGEIRRFLRDDGLIKVSRSIKDLSVRLHHLQNEMETEMGREITIGELAERAQIPIETAAMCEQATRTTDSLERPLSEEGSTLGELLGDNGIEDKITLRLSLKQAMQTLPQREKEVLGLRFGRAMTQAKVAAILGISQVQVSRIERHAIAALRKQML